MTVRLTIEKCECGHRHMQYSSTGAFDEESGMFIYTARCMENGCGCVRFIDGKK